MAIGPKHERWRRRPPASLQAGRRGATTGFAPPVTAQRWTCIDHGAAEGALPAANIDDFHVCLRWIRGSRIRVSHAAKRSVRPSPPVSDRPITDIAAARHLSGARYRGCDISPLRDIAVRDIAWYDICTKSYGGGFDIIPRDRHAVISFYDIIHPPHLRCGVGDRAAL